jgi:DNA gyrase/topoisomerase IV subunit B
MRFKGLGEMNPKQRAETTLDPKQRKLLRVTIESLLDADKTFSDLLGKDPSTRYTFIMESASQVGTEELDV